MAHDTHWWQLQLASPSQHYWKEHTLPAKGEYGGQCQHHSCSQTGADWYNRSSGKYYCDPCARAINELCLHQAMPKLCELHI